MKQREQDALNLAVPRSEPPPGLEDKILTAAQSSRLRPASRRGPWVPLLGAAALALAAGNIVQFVSPHAPAAPVSETMKPGLEVVMLGGTSDAPKAFGTIVLDPDDNHGILAVRDLPVTKGKYELWLRTETEGRSAGTFEVNDDGYGALLLTIPADFTGFHEFRLTPAGTRQVVMTGRY